MQNWCQLKCHWSWCNISSVLFDYIGPENKYKNKGRNVKKIIVVLIETHFNTFSNRTDPDQAALVRTA